ncbi:MAG: type II toxin-antitoxin system ParD family antitoxin [Gemmataceae bacterium]
MTASLPPDLQEFVKAELDRGAFANMDEMVEIGLRSLQQKLTELRAMVQLGLDQIARGEVEEFDPMADLEEIKRLHSQKAGAA